MKLLPLLRAPTVRRLMGLTAAAWLVACGQHDGSSTPAQTASGATACGRVTVASMNWPSAQVLAHIDRLILSQGYGCQVELVPGDTLPTLHAMLQTGQPDVVPEAWVNPLRPQLDEAVAQGRLHYAAQALTDGGAEGWWIPRYVADAHPDIKTMDDALKHPELFPSAQHPGLGAVHSCPPGWNCHTTNGNAFKAWGGADKRFVLVEPGSAAELDSSLAQAHARQVGWLGYHWAPNAVLAQYGMVKLDAGVPHNPAAFEACNRQVSCSQPSKTDWPRAEVWTLVTDRFEKTGGPAVRYLHQRAWDSATASRLLAWMNEHQASAADAAAHFLKTQPDRWTPWVSPSAARQIQARE